MRQPIDFRPLSVKDALSIFIGTAAVIAGLIQYHDTSRSEFLKPIREAQLNLYIDASSSASRLATLPPNEEEWKKARMDFLRLYYGPLAMFEDYRHTHESGKNQNPTVERAMIAFNSCLEDEKCVGTDDMKNLSLALAHTCRISLGSSWRFKSDQLRGDYQSLIQGYGENKD